VQLLAKRGKTADALAALRSLSALPTEDRWPFEAAMKALGSSDAAQGALLEASAAGGANPLVGSIWARSMADSNRWKECAEGLGRLKDGPWVEAAAEYVRALATARKKSELDQFVSASRDHLRAETLTWGAVGNAFESMGRAAECVEWMSDWRKRDGVRPWMLSALVVSYRTRKSLDEALEAGRGALGMAPDHSYPLHRLWVSFEDTVRGDAASGRAALEEVSADSLNSYYKCLRRLLQAVVELKPDGLRMASALMPSLDQEPALIHAYRAALQRISQAQGGFKGFWTRLRHRR
jgi:hypothetical protein